MIVRMEFNGRLKVLKKQYKADLKSINDPDAGDLCKQRYQQDKAELEKWLADELTVKIDKDVI